MSTTTNFISELFRAANELDSLTTDERRRLVDRAARMVREMRMETGIRPSRGKQDSLRDIEIAALMAEASGDDDDPDAEDCARCESRSAAWRLRGTDHAI